MNIYTTYPAIYIWACIIAGLLVSGVLYYSEIKRNRFSLSVIYSLAALRFVAFTLLSLLLLRPITQWENHVIEKPIVVALFDNSGSLDPKSTPSIAADLKKKLEALDGQAEVVYYAFDQNLKSGWDSINFKGSATDLSVALDQIATRYSGRNLASVVVATDGIFNQGVQPLYVAQNLQVPFYSIGLGDTSVYRDITIKDVEVNRNTFIGNSFPVQIHIEGLLVKGEKSVVSIEHKGQTIAQKEIYFNDNPTYLHEGFELVSKEKGTQRYTVKVKGVNNEKTLTNNSYDFYIQVLDERQKILLLAGAPHPDIAAIRTSFEGSDSYAIEFALANDWKGKLSDYGMVLYHGMPQNSAQLNIISEFKKNNIPALHLTTMQTQWNLLNGLQLGVNIQGANGSREVRSAQINTSFKNFQYPDRFQDLVAVLPPLEISFGKLTTAEGMSPFLFQKIGTLNTSSPLVCFGTALETPVGFVLGEGLWKWRMHNYLHFKNHDIFDDMVRSWIQFLANKNQDQLLKIISKKKWSVNEQILFQAQLLDASLKPFPNQDITIQIKDEKNNSLEYHFVPKDNQYFLSLGKLAPGAYRYVAQANNGNKDYKEEGNFVVEDIQLELIQTTAQHQGLRQISQSTGGNFYTPSQLDKLTQDLSNQKNLVSVSYDESTREEWIDLWPLYVLLMALFASEWFIRKLFGGY